METYETPKHPYKRQTVYVDDVDDYIRDDAVIVYEDNVKCDGEASINMELYGRK